MVDNRDGGVPANATSDGFNPKETTMENIAFPDASPSSGNVCPKCSYPTREGEKNCPNCGFSLTDGKKTEPDVSKDLRQGHDSQKREFGGTVIAGAADTGLTGNVPNRRLVGFLTTYSTNPNGEAFLIYEGRNYVGRASSSNICIRDMNISEKHLSILYRAVDKKFKFRDEQSSNGTFVNGILTDEGELKSLDVISIGTTKLIFIAIPQ
jgi:hypothetical protein